MVAQPRNSQNDVHTTLVLRVKGPSSFSKLVMVLAAVCKVGYASLTLPAIRSFELKLACNLSL